jgi:hypothetical protein
VRERRKTRNRASTMRSRELYKEEEDKALKKHCHTKKKEEKRWRWRNLQNIQ